MGALYLHQEGRVYSIYTPQGILIAQVFMGYDGQYARDAKCLDAIGRIMAKRWGLPLKRD